MRYLTTLLLAALTFNAVGQIQYDFPYNPDADNDAFVSSTDLLELLAIYGQEFNSDELYLSQDSTSLIVYVGDLDKVKCGAACVNLEGNWANLTTRDLSKHYDQLAIYPPLSYGNYDYVYMWYTPVDANSGFRPNPHSWSMNSRTRSTKINSDGAEYPAFFQDGPTGYEEGNSLFEIECWCVTHQRPNVEYKMFTYLSNDSETEEIVNSLAQEGWRLMPAMNGSEEKVTMWRWAD